MTRSLKGTLGVPQRRRRPSCEQHHYEVVQVTGRGFRYCINCGQTSVLWVYDDGLFGWVGVIEAERGAKDGVPAGLYDDQEVQPLPAA